MPYITQKDRTFLDAEIDSLIDKLSELSYDGAVNYAISRIMGFLYDTDSYKSYNAGIGVLECAKLEFYRRKVSVYEDYKIKLNGDV
jgi:hypothetical protein